MKYRILTDDELKAFPDEFKHFLIVNGVHAEEWEEMNKTDRVQALSLVELFSDTVLQKVYERMTFLEYRSEQSCMVFKCTTDQIELISINRKPESTVDLSTAESIHKVLVNQPEELTIFKTAKPYSKERELEVHEMVEQGCLNSSEAFWMLLEKVL